MPISRLNSVLREIDRKEKAEAYFGSIAISRLARIVVSAAGGAEASKTFKEESMLPFKAEDIYGNQKPRECRPRTLRAIKRLLDSARLPMHLLSVLKEEIDSLEGLQ